MVLCFDEGMNLRSERGKRLVGAQAVVAALLIAVFDALHQPSLADFDVFIQI